jgi:hypothetical protein
MNRLRLILLTLLISVPAFAQSNPKVINTSPEIGAVDVDPATTELRLEFDQEMSRGMSWTGGGEVFPEFDGKPTWESPTVCVATVKLKRGKFYRVGVNSSSYRNFQSKAGKPSEFAVLYFVTEGATDVEKAKADKPEIVSMAPENSVEDVDAAALTELVVTFDRPMGGGMSWTKAGGLFPETAGQAEWNEDKTACTLPVKLEPDTTYTLGINHPFANNFQSKWGVPVDHVVWTFTTAE